MTNRIRIVALAAPLLVVGCAREHLSPAFGRATREALAAQRARPPDQRPPPPNMALDTQETGVIANSYTKSLAGKTAQPEPQPVLYVAPEQQGGRAQRLAPSVPKE